jgi:hypothetical protein
VVLRSDVCQNRKIACLFCSGSCVLLWNFFIAGILERGFLLPVSQREALLLEKKEKMELHFHVALLTLTCSSPSAHPLKLFIFQREKPNSEKSHFFHGSSLFFESLAKGLCMGG